MNARTNRLSSVDILCLTSSCCALDGKKPRVAWHSRVPSEAPPKRGRPSCCCAFFGERWLSPWAEDRHRSAPPPLRGVVLVRQRLVTQSCGRAPRRLLGGRRPVRSAREPAPRRLLRVCQAAPPRSLCLVDPPLRCPSRSNPDGDCCHCRRDLCRASASAKIWMRERSERERSERERERERKREKEREREREREAHVVLGVYIYVCV